MIVHILNGRGGPLCKRERGPIQFRKPHVWPEDHKGVEPNAAADATCQKCIAAMRTRESLLFKFLEAFAVVGFVIGMGSLIIHAFTGWSPSPGTFGGVLLFLAVIGGISNMIVGGV